MFRNCAKLNLRIFTRVSLTLFFCLLASVVSAQTIKDPGFERLDNWLYSENDPRADLDGGQATDWKTEGNYSYKFTRRTGSTTADTWCQISQANVDFTNISSLLVDIRGVGVDTAEKLRFYADEVLLKEIVTDGNGSWGGVVELLNQEIPISIKGKHALIIRLYETNNYFPGDPKYFYIDNLRISNNPPSVGTITPSSGTSGINRAITFTTTYSDADPAGWRDIKWAYLLINTSTSGTNCFWGYYDQGNNKLYLRNNNNTVWLGGYQPGSAHIIENSYAKLDCSKTTVSGSGETLTINWNVTFKFAFGGKTYNTYLFVKDNQQAESGWSKKGTWRVDAIEITSFLPADKSRFIEGAVIRCSVTAAPENPNYQYQFLVDGQIKRAFRTNNRWNWYTASADIGVHTLTIQVKNEYGAQTEVSHRLIIYRRPIEQQE